MKNVGPRVTRVYNPQELANSQHIRTTVGGLNNKSLYNNIRTTVGRLNNKSLNKNSSRTTAGELNNKSLNQQH